MTKDVTINPTASCLVMTTEVCFTLNPTASCLVMTTEVSFFH